MKDTLDSGSITDSKADITFKNGYTFGRGLRISIGFLGVFGFFAILSGGPGLIIGPVLLVIAIYVLTSTHGTSISLSNGYVRSYTSSFGIKKGKWIPTVLLPDITILKMGNAVSISSIYAGTSVQLEENVYDIYLLSANHRKRILLRTLKTGKAAFIAAQELAELLDKNFVNFSPVISKSTLRKRYERH